MLKSALIAFLFLCLASPYVAAEHIKVALTQWTGYTNNDGSGFYHEVLKKAFPDDQLEYFYDTYRRNTHYFEQGSFDLILGVFPEDINNGVIPYWHLDFERPVVAFYNKQKGNIKSAKDLNGAMFSWMRGYNLGQYIDVPHQSYLVNSQRQGFELLLKNRTDVFADYEYNFFEEYRDKIGFFELIPARKTYIVFSNTPKGKALAKRFDARMLILRDEGVLANIYQQEYKRTKLAEVRPEHPKIQIRTRDLDLLLGDSSFLESSLESLLFSTLFRALPNYEFDLVKYSNFTDDVKAYSQSNNTCIANKIRTKAREQHFIFSEPVVMYPGLRLYATQPLNLKDSSQSIKLSALFASQPRLTIGVPEGQYFSKAINKELGELEGHQKVPASADVLTQLKAFAKKRFDLKIEFPVVMDNRWQYVSDKPLYSYPLSDAEPFNFGHLMCSKSVTNQAFINAFNQALATFKLQATYYQYHQHAAKSLSNNEFNQLFKQAFPALSKLH